MEAELVCYHCEKRTQAFNWVRVHFVFAQLCADCYKAYGEGKFVLSLEELLTPTEEGDVNK